MKASPVPGRFYTRKICQLDKPLRRDSCAETPSFGVAGFEIGECSIADGVDKNIARLTVQSLVGRGKPPAERFELLDIHGCKVRRLMNQADRHPGRDHTGGLVDRMVRWRADPAGRVMHACAERHGSHARPRHTSRIHSPKHAYRCRSRDVLRTPVRQGEWRDAARRSGRRADTAE